MFLLFQAQPLLRDRNKFKQMADPLLEDNYPIKGLYQALAVAAMCLQEEADTRPLISDVVTALEFLARKKEDGEEQNTKENFASQGENGNEDNKSNVVNDEEEDEDEDENDDDKEDEDEDGDDNEDENDDSDNENENDNEDDKGNTR